MILAQRPDSCPRSLYLEFDEDGQVDAALDFLQIRRKARHKCSRRPAYVFDDRSSGAGRRNSPGSREVRNIRRAVIELPAKSNVLAWHPYKGSGGAPGVKLVPWSCG